MLYFSRWKAIATLLTAFVVCLFAVPNFFSDARLKSLPTWAQRHVVLGLDLQGGSHILLEVDLNDVRKQKVESLRDDVRNTLRTARVGYTGLTIRDLTVEVRIREEADFAATLAKLRELSQPLGGLLSATGQRSVDVVDAGNRVVRLTITQPAITDRVRQVIDQAIQIVERRINAIGTVEPLIQRQGTDRILVQVPGVDDPKRILDLIGRTAKLTFRLVDDTVSPEQAQQGQLPPDSELLKGAAKEGGQLYVIKKQIMVSGEELVDAQPGFDQRTSEPIVSFKFNLNGARRFAQVTQENVGRPFAIVLDDEVISAPVIREPILGGSGQISGSFTVEQANDLSILLRAGALPARLTPIEQRVVGAGLGQDSIANGTRASYFGAILVILSMLLIYGKFGLIANIAVAINVAMIFGVLSLINATLTLPGIIGIVLTIGIAVDSNVLIYERIREEVRGGRTAIAAIDAGFTRALSTILDSNITTFIAATVLFFHPGLNLGIDFIGGTLLEIQTKSGPADIAKMRTTLTGLNLGDVQLQQFGGPENVLIRVAQQPGGEAAQQLAVDKIKGALGNDVEYRRVEVVGPRVSSELLSYGTLGIITAIGSILIYLWFRFEWQFALGAMIANVHDLVLTLGFMSLMQVDFDLTSIAALLTILGYSLNDTVVIYDRIREMLRRYKKLPMTDLLNTSINSTLSRSIITHLTVTLALLALFLFGGHAIHGFVTTMMFGVVLVGTYTSVFIASPILIYLGVGTGRQEATDPAAKSTNVRFSSQ